MTVLLSKSVPLDQISERVVHWLQESGLSVSFTPNVPDYFNITVSPPPPATGPILNIARPKQEAPFYVVGMGVMLHEEHYAKLSSLASGQRNAFLNELKYEYLRMNVDFVFLPPQAEIPRQIQLLKLIFLDGLTQNALYNTYTTVRNAGLLTIWKLIEKFGVAGAPQKEKSSYFA
ncbi:hypothetical protein B9P99_00770 [Candidatus Marsarchaeota G1 archaeon OSP_B]|uniref:DUF2299 domain-containing protein n=5 Tax=Candidatus Marsarchaeota TaxID=1978152 RepID=A0A2R6C374_9ARCH|nr:MAG: hypothetical protein B9Q01_07165 [Candidatus Marsarchaeota G1 archaeon OSP_D]PSN86084.1 MAG: hypothetical protein B9Q02_03655 [Candidatus Marsarchaeota G1 archaeon BE_D]PSN87592.1 MAG: hypothetical protein B9Q00_08405 [Candidatus Marsarchaeota G1 archaeon OSP_C]PSN95880.1 MAG: hypothetical protein B9P99_00770 [Candidatus Marsarchaeota G1 archaeon OSP_B]PSO05331.1 MAG: hypothetical protein B9Q12_00715 [Candidatus Marsarchaeota G2 archaeon ECH_B_SAG-G06]